MKNKFILSTIILIIGSFITKILSLLIKIVLSRSISTETLGLYMMLTPTLMLIVNISNFGIPVAISKLSSEKDRSSKKLLLSILPISIFINIILMIFIFSFAKTLSIRLLHNKDLYLGIISIALVIPFTTISSIIRSYFFGKEKVIPQVLSNLTESISRLLIYYYYLPYLKYKSISYTLAILILINVIVEIISIITMLLFLPKNLEIKKEDLKPNIGYIKDTLSISIPNTTNKFIGSIGLFLEPIILTNILKMVGYSNRYINYNYGIISGYIIPLLTMPSFITLAISQILLPKISKDYSNNNIKGVKRKIKLSIFISLIIGTIATIIFISIPDKLLMFIYKTNKGIDYLRILAPVFILQYIESILATTLEAIGKSLELTKVMIISTIIRIVSLIILSLFRIGLFSYIVTLIIYIIYTTYALYKKINNFI